MTKRETFLALAERCEREQPSRELDCDIALALGWVWVGISPRYWLEPGMDVAAFQAKPLLLDPRVHLAYPRLFTSSIDAAVTLVPDGQWDGTIMWNFDELKVGGFVELNCGPVTELGEHVACVSSYDGQEERNEMPTPRPLALALCAAALRAMAAMEGE